MIDLLGSKNLYEVLKELKMSEKIKNSFISTTLESQFSSTMSTSENNLSGLNEVEKQIIEVEFRKLFRQIEDRGNILIVDFLSERNNLGKTKNTKVTLNTEVKKYLADEKVSTMMLEERARLIPNLISNFIEVAEKYEKVIICEFYLTNRHIDSNNLLKLNGNQYSINKVNALLKTFYDYLKYNHPEFTYLNFEDLMSEAFEGKSAKPWIYSKYSIEIIGEGLNKSI